MESRNLDDLDSGWEGNNTKSLMGMSSALRKPRHKSKYSTNDSVRTSVNTGLLSVSTGLSSSEVRPAGKAPNVSLNWSCGDGGLEEISSSTGRRKDSATASRLCRRSTFSRWLRLQQQVGRRWTLTSAQTGRGGSLLKHQQSGFTYSMYQLIYYHTEDNPSQRTVSDLRLKQKPHYQDGFKSRFNFHCELKYVCRERLCSTKWSLV